MLCCIIPMAIAGVAALISGSSVALFSGPMLYVSIGCIALSTLMMGFFLYRYISRNFFNKEKSCCSSKTTGQQENTELAKSVDSRSGKKRRSGCCHSDMTGKMTEKPNVMPERQSAVNDDVPAELSSAEKGSLQQTKTTTGQDTKENSVCHCFGPSLCGGETIPSI